MSACFFRGSACATGRSVISTCGLEVPRCSDDVAIIKGGLVYEEKVDVRLEPLGPKRGLGLGFGRSFTGLS